MGEDSKNSSGRGILRAFCDAAMRGAKVYDRKLSVFLDSTFRLPPVSYTAEFSAEERAELHRGNAKHNFEVAMDILDYIPETHEWLKQATAAGVEIIPIYDSERQGRSVGAYSNKDKTIKLLVNIGAVFENEKDSQAGLTALGRDINEKDFQLQLVETLSHELKHFIQYRMQNVVGPMNVTAREHAIIKRVYEADAVGVGLAAVIKAEKVITLKNRGMSNKEIREEMTAHLSPEKEKSFLRKSFFFYLQDEYMHDYDAKSAQGSLDYGIRSGRIPLHSSNSSPPNFLHGRADRYHAPVSTKELVAALKQAIGEPSYLEGVSDLTLLKAVLRPMKDENKKAIWALDARERAANRARGLPLEKEKILTEKIEKRMAKVKVTINTLS